ncbi:hypothetical protein R3P38DRAFT_3169912 [Favolaschia claudopus]|uniref:Uncharacterized protein n=1 Tax=Favolaschia claudopus TaxID=2862362 RepID=A0AAW0DVJ0_9AGAR
MSAADTCFRAKLARQSTSLAAAGTPPASVGLRSEENPSQRKRGAGTSVAGPSRPAGASKVERNKTGPRITRRINRWRSLPLNILNNIDDSRKVLTTTRANNEGDEGDTDTDDDDEGKKKKRTTKDPSGPRVFGYPKAWVFVFQQVKDRKFIYLLNVNLFPDYETIEDDLRRYFNCTIARGHKRGLKLDEGSSFLSLLLFTAFTSGTALHWWPLRRSYIGSSEGAHLHCSRCTACRSYLHLAVNGRTHREQMFEPPQLPLKLVCLLKVREDMKLMKCKEEAVNVFNTYYVHLIHLTQDDYDLLGDPPNQEQVIQAKIEKVKNVLLLEGRFHLDGKDKNGKTNNFMHEALGNLALRIQKIGKKTIVQRPFKQIPDVLPSLYRSLCHSGDKLLSTQLHALPLTD